MTVKLSTRAKNISPSSTLALVAKVKAMKAKGEHVIGFGAGEPDFDTPDIVKEKAKQALDEGFTKYTPNPGIPKLREVIAKKLKDDNELDYESTSVLVSNGAKHSLFNAMLAICESGDEVILIAPYWVTYLEQVKFAGGIPKILNTTVDNDFQIDIEDLKALITDKTKLILLNSPSNPTGAVYSEDFLKKLSEIVVKNDLYIISDEIYEKIIFEGEHKSIASFNEDIKKRTIVINGVSKSCSMTGWRIGYAAAEPEIIKAMANIQSHSTSNANSIAQKASISAITECEDAIANMVKSFKERRDYIVGRLQSMEGIKCNKPQGAFYVFPDISYYFGKKNNGKEIVNCSDFCNILLEEKKVAVVPGDSFGNDKSVRFSYALSLEEIKDGMNRFEEFLKSLR